MRCVRTATAIRTAGIVVIIRRVGEYAERQPHHRRFGLRNAHGLMVQQWLLPRGEKKILKANRQEARALVEAAAASACLRCDKHGSLH